MGRAVAELHGLLSGGGNRKTLRIANRVRLWKLCLLKLLGEPSNPAGGTRLIIRCLIVPLTMAVIAVQATPADAQGAFPAPLPGAARTAPDSAFPPVNGSAPSAMVGAPSAFPSGGAPPVSGGFAPPQQQQAAPPGAEECMNGFMPLRQEAEKRGLLIKAANERRATPDEACKLFNNYAQSEIKMIKYVESHQQKCRIPAEIGEQLRTGHKNTEGIMKKVCDAAKMQARGPAGPSLSDVLGSSTALPEATAARKSGGTTFDTLNGNVLAR